MSSNRSYSTCVATISRWDMLRPGDRVIIGLSGGADSVSLLHFLDRLRRQRMPSLSLYACHLNHMLRGASADADEEFSVEAARRLGISCHVRRVDVPALAKRRKAGIEEAARFARYGFYRDLAADRDASCIALGHHSDDNIETILYRMRRGCHQRGLAGIPPVRALGGGDSDARVVRPLINCRAAELRRGLREKGIAWREDASNHSCDYARNRIRHHLLPQLEETDTKLRPRLLRQANAAWRRRVVLRESAGAVFRRSDVRSADGRVFLPLDILRSDDELAGEVLWCALGRVGAPMGRISRRHFAALKHLIRRPEDTGSCDLPGRLRAERRHGVLALMGEDACANEPGEETAIPVPGVTAIPWLTMQMTAESLPGEFAEAKAMWQRKGSLEEVLDDDRCPRPLAVRPWRQGDRIRPLGAPGTRKVQDILSEARVPRSERQRVGILTAAGRPIWVIGHRLDDGVRVGSRTRRLLHLRGVHTDSSEII